MSNRRDIEEFSVSFLDVICCGFGAIILLLIITKTVQPCCWKTPRSTWTARWPTASRRCSRFAAASRTATAIATAEPVQLDDNLLELASLQQDLTDILGRFAATARAEEEDQVENQNWRPPNRR